MTKTKQRKTKQNKTKQNKTKQNKPPEILESSSIVDAMRHVLWAVHSFNTTRQSEHPPNDKELHVNGVGGKVSRCKSITRAHQCP